MKVVVGASSFAGQSDKAMNILLGKGITVIKNPFGRKMNESEIIDHLQGADGLLAGLEPLTENVLDKAKSLKAIARIGIGMENVDIDAAKARGIKVSNTPDAPTEAVAEMALAALLTIARQIIPLNHDMHQRCWNKRIGFSLYGLKVLLVGYGRIAKKFESLLEVFNIKPLIYDPYQPQVSIQSLQEGMQQADVISLHASNANEIITAEMFAHMKKGVVILNSARGALINEDALYSALKDGTVGNYWGDVFLTEPYRGKLTECGNAILTPHVATYSGLCREKMETEAVMNLLGDLYNV